MGLPESLLTRLDQIVLPWGYERRKAMYRRRRDGNIAVLYLAGGADPDFATFDGQLGVLSGRLSAVFGPRMSFQVPGSGTHHWLRWHGDLNMPEQPESGLNIYRLDGEWDTAEAERALTRAILPALEGHSTDEGLRDDWLVNRDTWLTEPEQLGYLIVLLRAVGPADQIPGLQQRLRNLVAHGDRSAIDVARKGVLD